MKFMERTLQRRIHNKLCTYAHQHILEYLNMNEEIKSGYSFEENIIFSESELIKMATDCGDMNFIHHNKDQAKDTRFGGIIASGSAISARFSAMIPTHMSKISPMLGLEMSFKFPAPIKPNRSVIMKWEVTKVEHKSNVGNIISLLGTITDKTGGILVTGAAKILLLSSL